MKRWIGLMLVVCLLLPFSCYRVGSEDAPTALDEGFTELLSILDELDGKTASYYKTANTIGKVAQYLRSDRYKDSTWKMAAGSPETKYVNTMTEYQPLRELENVTVFTVCGEPYEIDFTHLAAVIDVKRAFGGWAGDLVSFADTIQTQEEARDRMCDEKGAFNLADYRADLDAVNIMAQANGRGSFADALRTYYTGQGVRFAATTFLRYALELTEDITVEAIEQAVLDRVTGPLAESQVGMLIRMYNLQKRQELIEYAALAFAEELYRGYCGETLGHDEAIVATVDPDCTHGGYRVAVCFRCGEIRRCDWVEALPHTLTVWTRNPSAEKPGLEVKLCTVCGLCEDTEFDSAEVGDLNFDGVRNASDFLLLKRAVLRKIALTERQRRLADLDGNGSVGASDYLLLLRMILGQNVTVATARTANEPE